MILMCTLIIFYETYYQINLFFPSIQIVFILIYYKLSFINTITCCNS